MLLDKIKLLYNAMITKCTKGSLRERAPFLIGGIVVGVLGLWLVLKVMAIGARAACEVILRDTGVAYRESKPVPVEAAVVKEGTISRRIVTVGRLRGKDEVMLKAEVHGRIDQILVQEGTHVEKGDLLIQFDDADTKAALKQAEAEFTLHQAEYERISTLHSKNIQSNKQLDEIIAKRDMAEGKVEEAKATLDKKAVNAPFSGTLGLISVSPGAYVQMNHELGMLVNTTPIIVEFKVPEGNVGDVGPGQIAEATVEGFPDEIFRFTVEAVDSKVNEVSHSLAIRASNPNEGNQLHAGRFAKVSLIVGDKPNALIIPEIALHREGEAEFVWAIKKGKAGRMRVISGTRENNTVEIVAGLKPGAIVVTAGQLRLGEGSPVRITNLDEEGNPKTEDSKQKTEDAAGSESKGSSEDIGQKTEAAAKTEDATAAASAAADSNK